jgi:hypothetical protein
MGFNGILKYYIMAFTGDWGLNDEMWQKNRVAPIYCRQMTATWGKINLACLPL